jgi:5-methylcytosine-specific restriction endonuclease McrA
VVALKVDHSYILLGGLPMKESICVCCQSSFKYKPAASLGKYCSNACQHKHQLKVRIDSWLNGDKSISTQTIKKHLLNENPSCSSCGISNWNNLPLVLELEHKDGNAENNQPSNVCLICPNCHSQTPTYKNKNRGNGRHNRRERYKQGKSY